MLKTKKRNYIENKLDRVNRDSKEILKTLPNPTVKELRNIHCVRLQHKQEIVNMNENSVGKIKDSLNIVFVNLVILLTIL